jgi:hypothetical protein
MLRFQRNQSILTSAATILKESVLASQTSVPRADASKSFTNDFAAVELLATDRPGKATKGLPLEFTGQTDTVAEAADFLTVRSDFTMRNDALISGSKATGFLFSLGRLSRASIKAGEDRDWQNRDTATFSGLSSNWVGRDESREPQGLRLFRWSW